MDYNNEWDEEFYRDYPVSQYQEIDSYWWRDCYSQIHDFVLKNVKLNESSTILECGAGTGNSSLLLAKKVKQVFLLDSSKNALQCARKLANYYNASNVSFIEADFLSIDFKSRVDLCWNVGVLEHYKENDAVDLVAKMIDVTNDSGYIIIGVPNFDSLPIIKAKLLSSKFFNKVTSRIGGYRLKDEKKYKFADLKRVIFSAAKKSNVIIDQESFVEGYAGSFLPVESPKWFYSAISFCHSFFKKRSFLLLVTFKIYR